jgi:hypothetical protein
MFKQPERARFLYNLDGGDLGGDIPKPNPAWDYILLHPDIEVGKTYRWDTCLVVKPFQGREDILREVRSYITR